MNKIDEAAKAIAMLTTLDRKELIKAVSKSWEYMPQLKNDEDEDTDMKKLIGALTGSIRGNYTIDMLWQLKHDATERLKELTQLMKETGDKTKLHIRAEARHAELSALTSKLYALICNATYGEQPESND